jgi:hypothetical protein
MYIICGTMYKMGKIFHTHPDQLCSPPSLLYNGYWVFARGGGLKQLGCGFDHLSPSSAEVKERASYTSTPPLGLHGLFWGMNFTFTFTVYKILSSITIFYGMLILGVVNFVKC